MEARASAVIVRRAIYICSSADLLTSLLPVLHISLSIRNRSCGGIVDFGEFLGEPVPIVLELS
jgi:hypothetical protein